MSSETSDSDKELQAQLLSELPEDINDHYRMYRLIGWILFLVFIALLPILYISGNINKETINRIGILLNFIAGFMAAPEFIGKYRLVRWEGYIQQLFNETSKSITRNNGHIFISNTLFIMFSSILIAIMYSFLFVFVPIEKDMPYLFKAMFLIFLYVFPLIAFIVFIAFVSIRILPSLQNRSRIRSLLLSWGIALFILGNLLQFIASF